MVATDWDSAVWHAADRARMLRVIEAFAAHCPHPHLPCTLGPRLAAAGVEVVAQEVFVLHNNRHDPDTYSHGASWTSSLPSCPVMASMPRRRRPGWTTCARGEAGDYFFSLNRYFFLVKRP